MKKILFFLFQFIISALWSQNRYLDSLTQLYNSREKHDTIRLSALNAIAFEYVETKPDTAILLSNQLKSYAEDCKNKKYLGLSYRNIAMALETKGENDKGLDNYLTALNIYEEAGYKTGLVKTYLLVGHNYRTRFNYPKAIEYYIKGLELSKETGNPNYENVYYFQIGIVYSTQANFEMALKYHELALKMAEKAGNKDQIANCSYMIAQDNERLNKLIEAEASYSKALHYYEELDYAEAEASCNSGLGDIFLKKQDFKKALDYYKKSLAIRKQAQLEFSYSASFHEIAILFSKAGDHQLSLRYADSAMQLAKNSEDNIVELAGLYETMAEGYYKTGKYKEAYESYMQFKTLNDSIEKESNGQSINEVIAKLENEKKDAEQEKLKLQAEEQQKRQQLVIFSIGLVLLIVIIFSVLLYRRFRITNKQKEVIEAKSHEIEEKNKEITDSIRYAKRIQNSLLPTEKYIRRVLQDKKIQ